MDRFDRSWYPCLKRDRVRQRTIEIYGKGLYVIRVRGKGELWK
jgi:hypothetical protein